MKEDNIKEFANWHEAEMKNAQLVDLKFFIGEPGDATIDSFSQEALAMLQAPASTNILPESF